MCVCIYAIDCSYLCGDNKLNKPAKLSFKGRHNRRPLDSALRFSLNLYSQQQRLRSICSLEGGRSIERLF